MESGTDLVAFGTSKTPSSGILRGIDPGKRLNEALVADQVEANCPWKEGCAREVRSTALMGRGIDSMSKQAKSSAKLDADRPLLRNNDGAEVAEAFETESFLRSFVVWDPANRLLG